uniref:Uncharacterized protein n=1 Tax=Glossina palpalis gambiensis TaxID=67801 RepID=A0A1B0AM65_9MUSC
MSLKTYCTYRLIADEDDANADADADADDNDDDDDDNDNDDDYFLKIVLFFQLNILAVDCLTYAYHQVCFGTKSDVGCKRNYEELLHSVLFQLAGFLKSSREPIAWFLFQDTSNTLSFWAYVWTMKRNKKYIWILVLFILILSTLRFVTALSAVKAPKKVFAPIAVRNLVEAKAGTRKKIYTIEYHSSTNYCAEIAAILATQLWRVMADMAIACKDRCLHVRVCLRARFCLRSPLNLFTINSSLIKEKYHLLIKKYREKV